MSSIIMIGIALGIGITIFHELATRNRIKAIVTATDNLVNITTRLTAAENEILRARERIHKMEGEIGSLSAVIDLVKPKNE